METMRRPLLGMKTCEKYSLIYNVDHGVSYSRSIETRVGYPHLSWSANAEQRLRHTNKLTSFRTKRAAL